MNISPTDITVFIALFVVASTAAAMGTALIFSNRRVERIMDQQHRSLMAFHTAGQSLAAHQLQLARIDLELRQADNEKVRLEHETKRVVSVSPPPRHGRLDPLSVNGMGD